MVPFKLRDESDDDLMMRVQDEDADAFGELYDRHAGPAFAVAQAVCRNTGLAEEAVQEGFLSIWRGRSTYRPLGGATFRGWAMQTVRNRAIDSYRRQSAAKAPPIADVEVLDLPGAASASALDEVIERGERKTLESLMKRLPDAQAEVIGLAFFGGMTHTEIARQLDLPAGTVKGRMRLGLEKLRSRIEAD